MADGTGEDGACAAASNISLRDEQLITRSK
jgi:hypothetical protein